jgi:predicted DNA-binding transcriptional regulator YafY
VPEGDWIVNMLLGFGPGLRILEPARLRCLLAETAAGISAANASPGEAEKKAPIARKS